VHMPPAAEAVAPQIGGRRRASFRAWRVGRYRGVWRMVTRRAWRR
jgi:hypothetical protein